MWHKQKKLFTFSCCNSCIISDKQNNNKNKSTQGPNLLNGWEVVEQNYNTFMDPKHGFYIFPSESVYDCMTLSGIPKTTKSPS